MPCRDSLPGQEAPPPFLRSWGRVYAAVVIYTCLMILVLYWLTVELNR